MDYNIICLAQFVKDDPAPVGKPHNTYRDAFQEYSSDNVYTSSKKVKLVNPFCWQCGNNFDNCVCKRKEKNELTNIFYKPNGICATCPFYWPDFKECFIVEIEKTDDRYYQSKMPLACQLKKNK